MCACCVVVVVVVLPGCSNQNTVSVLPVVAVVAVSWYSVVALVSSSRFRRCVCRLRARSGCRVRHGQHVRYDPDCHVVKKVLYNAFFETAEGSRGGAALLLNKRSFEVGAEKDEITTNQDGRLAIREVAWEGMTLTK